VNREPVPRSNATMARLTFFADPLCSWCYGFGPELEEVLENHPELEVELVMGGLRAFNTERMSAAFRDMLRGHWSQVAAASGMPFSEAILARDDFIYDTEPPCRAVVTARTIDASRSAAYFKSVQLAFYRDGRDVTDASVLAGIAVEGGYDGAEFARALDSREMREATRADFAHTQALGIAGFPTLAIAYGAQLYLVTSGFVTDDVLEHRLAEIERLLLEQSVAQRV
jgi:putative protein-disulfide isomerase